MSEIVSRPYSTDAACERCAFGHGDHADFCELRVRSGCECHLPFIAERRGEPHSTACSLYEKRESHAA